MKTTNIRFKATTIKLKEFIGDTQKEIGSISGDIYTILNYLGSIGINVTMQQIYYYTKKKSWIFRVTYKQLNNVVYDWKYNEIVKKLKALQFDFHIKLERIKK
jgi:hypothetical protein